MGCPCEECGRSRWAWLGGPLEDPSPVLACTKPPVPDPATGRLVLPATAAGRIREGYGPPQAKPDYFYPWPCEPVPDGRTKEPPRQPGVLAGLGALLRGGLRDGLGAEDGLHAYAESLGAEVSS